MTEPQQQPAAPPARSFHPAPSTFHAWFVNAYGTRRVLPVVGYYDDSTDTVPAVLLGAAGIVRPVHEVGSSFTLVTIIDDDADVPGREEMDRGHQSAAEPKLTAAWSQFHATRPHEACGHTPPDGWWESQPDNATWGPGADTPEAAELRSKLAAQYNLDPRWAGCPHEYVDCSVEFCGRDESGEAA